MLETIEAEDRLEGLEARGTEPIKQPDKFAGRGGYDVTLLIGWDLPLPLGIGPAAGDMQALRRGGDGVELKYHNFSVVMSASRRLPMITAANIDGAEWRRVPRIDTPFFGDDDLAHRSGARIPMAFWKVVAIVTEDGKIGRAIHAGIEVNGRKPQNEGGRQ